MKSKDGKNTLREAAAISYQPGESAPRVVAAGQGFLAEKILETAKQAGVPLHEDPGLAHALNMLKLGEEIPPELYTVVAKILLFIADVDKIKSGFK